VPQHLDADVSALRIGDSLRIGDLPLPAGVTLLDDPETVVASVTTPMREEAAEPAEGEEAAEGEAQAGAEGAEAESAEGGDSDEPGEG
jgi:large subunit ribosomal protein L25